MARVITDYEDVAITSFQVKLDRIAQLATAVALRFHSSTLVTASESGRLP